MQETVDEEVAEMRDTIYKLLGTWTLGTAVGTVGFLVVLDPRTDGIHEAASALGAVVAFQVAGVAMGFALTASYFKSRIEEMEP